MRACTGDCMKYEHIFISDNRRSSYFGAIPMRHRPIQYLFRYGSAWKEVRHPQSTPECGVGWLLSYSVWYLQWYPRCHTAWEIRAVSAIVAARFLDDDEVLHGCFLLGIWACLNMLASVPGSISSLGLPAMVTRPFLLGCLYDDESQRYERYTSYLAL